MSNVENYGCSHYKRKVKLLAPCCEKIYSCRFCHDEAEDHELIRKNVRFVICSVCNNEQQCMNNVCCFCGIKFSDYYCGICVLFDEFKYQFHCKDCGICRVGPKELFYHCPTCNLCLNLQLYGKHKCIENSSKTDCPICLEFLHTSRSRLHVPKCGHLIHQKCYDSLIKGAHQKKECPVCKLAYK